MPCPNADAIGAFEWLMPALEKDLKESKMWPIRLFQHKHQDTLRLLHMLKRKPVTKLHGYYAYDTFQHRRGRE